MAKKLRLKDYLGGNVLDDSAYSAALKQLHKRLQVVQTAYILQKRAAVIVLEGWDAAGKGGAIKRLTEPLDPRFVRVWPIAAPDDHEKREHYLQRFWRRLPRDGELAVFDRSWYGRVLVERVEGFATKEQWTRAYDEIVEFERMLCDDHTRIVKLFLNIDKATQAKRLIERAEVPYKRWKTGLDDYRNRAQWAAYEKAIEDMFARTSSSHAPWTVIDFTDKNRGRIDALKAILAVLEKGIDLSDPPLDPALRQTAEAALGVTLKV
jgi:AMP-polyphosphate phosphotransferase